MSTALHTVTHSVLHICNLLTSILLVPLLWLTLLKACMYWQMIMAGKVAVAVEGEVLVVVTVAVAEGILGVAEVLAGAVLLEDPGTGLAQAAIITALPASEPWCFVVVLYNPCSIKGQ